MTRKDIIRMAREAGFERLGHTDEDWVCYPEDIERFAALVASAEREACIKAIEEQIGWDMDDPESTAINAIRARGQA